MSTQARTALSRLYGLSSAVAAQTQKTLALIREEQERKRAANEAEQRSLEARKKRRIRQARKGLSILCEFGRKKAVQAIVKNLGNTPLVFHVIDWDFIGTCFKSHVHVAFEADRVRVAIAYDGGGETCSHATIFCFRCHARGKSDDITRNHLVSWQSRSHGDISLEAFLEEIANDWPPLNIESIHEEQVVDGSEVLFQFLVNCSLPKKFERYVIEFLERSEQNLGRRVG